MTKTAAKSKTPYKRPSRSKAAIAARRAGKQAEDLGKCAGAVADKLDIAIADMEAHDDSPQADTEVVRSLADIDTLTIDDFADFAIDEINLQPGEMSTVFEPGISPEEHKRRSDIRLAEMIDAGNTVLGLDREPEEP